MKTLKEIEEQVMKMDREFLDGYGCEDDDVFDEMFRSLNEGSGVITNSISIGLVKSLRKLDDKIKRTKDVGKKCDLLSVMVTIIGGLVLVSIGVSGDKKGILSKGMSLLSIVTGLRSKRR